LPTVGCSMTHKITLYTSLAPKVKRFIGVTELGHAYTAECVHSWRRAGFDVVSLNNANEIERLKPFGYEAAYVEIDRERPAISDFLNVIARAGDPVAGIINADIFLSNDSDLLRSVVDQSAAGMTIIERVNIDPVGLMPSAKSCYGFDAFIFRTDLISEFDLNCPEFLFGHPWWDYWFPLAFAAAGGRLMTTVDPFIFHLVHHQNWSHLQWIDNARKTIRCFVRSTGRLPADFASCLERLSDVENLSENELGTFAHWCFNRLRSMAELIRVSPEREEIAVLPALASVLDDPHGRRLLVELNEVRAYSQDFMDSMQHISWVVSGSRIANQESALRTIDGAAQILTSRKAMIAHFVALNLAWAKRMLSPGARATRNMSPPATLPSPPGTP
jgi:hypothetical protein